jgi:hypothetical protein
MGQKTKTYSELLDIIDSDFHPSLEPNRLTKLDYLRQFLYLTLLNM